MKAFIELFFGIGLLLVIIFGLLLLVGEVFWNLSTYDQLITVEGQLVHLESKESTSSSKSEYYYFTILTKEGAVREVKVKKSYVQHIVYELQPQDMVTVKAEKDNWARDILWVWEVKKGETALLPYEEMFEKQEASRRRTLNWLKLGLAACMFISIISAFVLVYVFKVNPRKLGYIALHSLSEKNIEEERAEKIVKDIDKYYVSKHQYREVDTKDFRHLDLDFYDETMKELRKKGFTHLIDEEDLTMKGGLGDMRTFMRVALGDNGIIMAAFYHPKPKFWIRWLLRLLKHKLGKAIEFETEFSDGSFLTTSNVKFVEDAEKSPKIISEYLPWNTPLNDLLERHKQKIADYQQTVHGVEPVVLKNLDDVKQSQARSEEIKAAYRKQIGGVTQKELHQLTGGDKELAVEVSRKLEERQAPATILTSDSEETEFSIEEKALRLFKEPLKDGGDRVSYLVAILATILVGFSALSVTGFGFESLAKLSLPVLIAISVVGSLIFFCLYYPDRRYWYMGILPGLFTGPLVFVAIILYTYWRKEIWTYEPVIPMLIGAAPGLALWYFSLRRVIVRNLKRELTQELSGQEEQKHQEKVVKTLIPPSQEAPEQEKPAPTEAAAEKRYCVVFYGKIAQGQQLEDVKQRVATLYKSPVARCEGLFTGRRKIVKNDIDYQTAEKYKRAFEKTGAVCHIEELK